MQKLDVLKEIFELENISEKIKICEKITEQKLLLVLSKTSYNLKEELNISATTVSRYLSKLFPDKPKNTSKVCNYLLYKYGYKQCKRCEEVFELEYFYANSRTKDLVSAYCKKCQANLEKPTSVQRSAKYRAAKIKRIPSWITEEEIEKISLFYTNCPEGYHVDHIIPLQGINVSGFHTLNNLQYLSAQENSSKKNKYLPL